VILPDSELADRDEGHAQGAHPVAAAVCGSMPLWMRSRWQCSSFGANGWCTRILPRCSYGIASARRIEASLLMTSGAWHGLHATAIFGTKTAYPGC
jgi:hypothetical protein